jgi:hypothetical protein
MGGGGMTGHTSNFHRKIAATTAFSLILSLGATTADGQSLPSRGDVTLGYSSIPYLQDSSGSLPAGWIVAFTQFDENRPLGFVVEVSGNYGIHSERLYTALAGVKVMPQRRARARPFGQVLAGVMTVGCCDESHPYFTVEPGGGVDISLNDRVGVRLAGSMPLVFAEGTAAKAVRGQAGIVLGF